MARFHCWLRRVSVAVALNQGAKALGQADLAKTDNLVKGAIGFDAARGDMVAIGQRPFAKVEDASPAFWDQGWFLPVLKQVGGILARTEGGSVGKEWGRTG